MTPWMFFAVYEMTLKNPEKKKLQAPLQSWKTNPQSLCLPIFKHPHILQPTDMFAAKHSSILRATASGTLIIKLFLTFPEQLNSPSFYSSLSLFTCSCSPYLGYHWI
jgi:hypothetical protein